MHADPTSCHRCCALRTVSPEQTRPTKRAERSFGPQKGASAHSQRSNTRVRDLPGIIEARRKRVAQRSDRVALLGPRTLQRVPTTTSRALRVSPSNPHHPERHMRAYGPASHNHQPKSELSSTKRPREHRLTQLSRCALPSRQAARANPRAEALQAVRQNQPRATSSRSRALGQASGPTKPTARNVQPKPETRPSKRADRTNRLQRPAEAENQAGNQAKQADQRNQPLATSSRRGTTKRKNPCRPPSSYYIFGGCV